MTFLISFILRVLPRVASFEAVGAVGYGRLLVGSLAMVLLAAVGLLVQQVRRRRRFYGRLANVVESQFEMALNRTESPLFRGGPASR